jgi:hypothetical protein
MNFIRNLRPLTGLTSQNTFTKRIIINSSINLFHSSPSLCKDKPNNRNDITGPRKSNFGDKGEATEVKAGKTEAEKEAREKARALREIKKKETHKKQLEAATKKREMLEAKKEKTAIKKVAAKEAKLKKDGGFTSDADE